MIPWRIKIFFYLSIGCSSCGFFFPTYVTQAIGFDVGDMVHWIYGYYTLYPRNPIYVTVSYLNDNHFQAFFLIFNTIFLFIEITIQMRYSRLDDGRYKKNRIYIIACLQLLASVMYISSEFVVYILSSWGFVFSATFALIGNKELKLHYVDKRVINEKIELIIWINLIPFSLYILVASITTILEIVTQENKNDYVLLLVSSYFPILILSLITTIYGSISFVRAIKQHNSKTKQRKEINGVQ